ncbi:MAG: adenine phosphoribosyltransferase [Firmicutes bacterium]|nr:adenine phosphoribosyltransferase [Bacillota bacterium]
MDLEKYITVIEDFPKKGISFKDITSLLSDGAALKEAIKVLADPLRDKGIKYIVAPEARGFMFGSAVAYELGIGFIPIRKAGKLPRETVSYKYEKEYGEDELFMHKDAINKGDKVAIIDDLLATGGTISAVNQLLKAQGADVVSIGFLIELTGLKGEDAIDAPVYSIIKYEF